MTTTTALKSGDEVCKLVDDELIFGTLEYPVAANSSASRRIYNPNPIAPAAPNADAGGDTAKVLWKVKWIHDPSRTISPETPENELIPTDRALFKGCKVRRMETNGTTKVGICRSVLYRADLRILGTNTVIPNVNIEEFSHLKEYKQKSVVHYNGWLGVITSVQRAANVYQGGAVSTVDLKQIIPTGPLNVEDYFINEQVDIPVRHITSSTMSGSNNNNNDTTNQNSQDSESSNHASKKMRRTGFIKDLQVVSVKVDWLHQIDAKCPDKPKQEFKGESCFSLEVIKEDVSIDDASFNFEVGSIGRYTITSQTEYRRWDIWQKNFANQNLPKGFGDRLQNDLAYIKNLKDKYWRAYEVTSYNSKEDDTLERISVGKRLVVEIVHISCIADVRWEDNSSDILPSSLDLELVDEQIVHDTDIPRAGDFIHVKSLPYESKDAFCVVIKEERDAAKTKLIVRVLDANIPTKVILDNKALEGELRMSSKKIEQHPVFGYFNEPTTIVVVNDSENDQIKIGNVIGTNLQGKVNVRFRQKTKGTGPVYKEQWLWPQACAIYSVKGYDLECVKSHVTDSDADNEPEVKLRRIIESFRNKVLMVWKNNSKLEDDLQVALDDFSAIYSSLENFVKRQSLPPIASVSYLKLKAYLEQPAANRSSFLKGDFQLAELLIKAVEDLLSKCDAVLQQYSPEEDVVMEDVSSPSCSGASENKLTELFSKTVALLDSHPDGHHFAKSTTYEPTHHGTFRRTVMEELKRLREMCSTATQAETGILIKTYSSRMDLFSILIRGPEGTPYENGLYIFDAVMPASYPNVPPNFHFHSYRAGRLNPNLYAEGKVCVSLLGTWSGKDEREKWTKDSSIVQVLISIQGLILVTEPYHNEPGLEKDKYTGTQARAHCLSYNQQLMPLIGNMMLNQLEYPMDPWKDEINEFYKMQLPLFISRWRTWLNAKSESSLKSTDRPEFAIFPLTSTFKLAMEPILTKLETKCQELHKTT